MFKIKTVKQDDGSISEYKSDIIEEKLSNIIKTSELDLKKYINEPIRKSCGPADLLSYIEYKIEKLFADRTEVTAEEIKDVVETTIILNAYPEIVKNYFKIKTEKAVEVLTRFASDCIETDELIPTEEKQEIETEETVKTIPSPEDIFKRITSAL